MEDAVDAVIRALSARDLESFLARYAADARIEDASGASLASGHAEIRRRYEEMFRQFPDLHVRGCGRMSVGSYVVQEEEVLGRAPEPERHIAIYRLTADGLIAHERLLR